MDNYREVTNGNEYRSPYRKVVDELMTITNKAGIPLVIENKRPRIAEKLALDKLQMLIDTHSPSESEDWRIKYLQCCLPIDTDSKLSALLKRERVGKPIPDALMITHEPGTDHVSIYAIDFKLSDREEYSKGNTVRSRGKDLKEKQISVENTEELIKHACVIDKIPEDLRSYKRYAFDGRLVRIRPASVTNTANLDAELLPYKDQYKDPQYTYSRDETNWEIVINSEELEQFFPHDIYDSIMNKFAITNLNERDIVTGYKNISLINTCLFSYFNLLTKTQSSEDAYKIIKKKIESFNDFPTFVEYVTDKVQKQEFTRDKFYNQVEKWENTQLINLHAVSRDQRARLMDVGQQLLSFWRSQEQFMTVAESYDRLRTFFFDIVAEVQQKSSTDFIPIINDILRKRTYSSIPAIFDENGLITRLEKPINEASNSSAL